MTKVRGLIIGLAVLAAILVIIMPALGGLGSRFGFWDFRFGFGTMTGDGWTYTRYASLGLGALAILLSLVFSPRRLAGLVIGAAAIAVPLGAKMQMDATWAEARKYPPIHDITTDREDPPMFTSAILNAREAEGANPTDYIGKVKPGRNGAPDELVSDVQAAAFPDIVPIERDVTMEAAFDEALSAAKSLGWTVVSEDRAAGLIEATATTFWYGFKDDVVIRVRASEDGGSVVDIRSVSRVGMGDMGANAKRIRAFRDKLTG